VRGEPGSEYKEAVIRLNNRMMLELNDRRKSGTLKNQRIKGGITRELRNDLERNEKKTKRTNMYGTLREQ